MSDQVEALKGVAEGALREAADLAVSLDDRSRTLTERGREHVGHLTQAAGSLESIEERVSQAMAERSAAIEGVLSRIEERSSTVEAQTARFNAAVEETIRTAEERARSLGASLSETARNAGVTVASEFERLRGGASSEGERTTQVVQAAIATASQQMMEVFGTASSRFGESVTAMREMAAEIRRELDATRADLQRGVLEIPRETQDATGEMRRVVSDQIKALNELSALVVRSNRSIDVAQPGPVAKPSAPVQAAVVTSPTAPQNTARTTEPGAGAEAQRNGGQKGDPKPQGAAQAGPAPSRSVATVPVEPTKASDVTRVGAAPRRDEVRGGRDNRGWLSDLLTRASIDEGADEDVGKAVPAAAKPAPSNALPAPSGVKPAAERRATTLDTLTTDIAKMIDHPTAVDLWERYRRGEPNLFDRKLYTLQGRQTFEEIRRRYATDADFHRTVDRYVSEFERLLGDVSKNDRDSRRADAYLTSETGKVYTMLAHASGRFDGA